ncbi:MULTISPECIES: SDR family NAD(P)-dependent oxidoreductase [Flagellimonas]|jgi:3-oxoacyl-[acyl-carrier protein] reductase|uniref:Glucose 1-dehydrogenase n=2 Tax=Flagellimonas TaxID=444459 RepID=A0ABT5XRQ9_9FLAO|nr:MULTISPECIES: glucose 1-dehydrogenase [Allomuricauda]MAO15613.1 oxidoreductase [Allomuricauda sp.]MBO0356254.1 glucose 1-dehydrogenase [Allomuricauda aurea]MDF0708585.1 glucose 1-dehydrogenase [[Muricauda] okinawensis]UBZ14592.1 glucose 1-dehydrogenase [Allomuricauda aquimarina]|tara:strand:+ start:13864 stop:14619 length:756 start_codon:yes stop_codon:yes gene_type:complete
MSDLKGKVAVVTGGARDIGRAVSLKLAKNGAKVVVNYFENRGDANDTVKMIKNNGGDAIAVYADATSLSDLENLASKTKEAFGDKVDILVNVAGGLFARKTIDQIDEKFYDLLMDVNFKSCVFVTQTFKTMMVEGGSIVNFASQAGRDGGGPGASLYAASKGAVMTFTRAMAKEFGPQGIRVNALCPGMIATKFHDDFTKDEVRAKVAGSTPLKREGNASEVADLVAYLASSEASFITGNNVDINGGLAFS